MNCFLKSIFPVELENTHAIIKNKILTGNYKNTNMYGSFNIYSKDLDYTTPSYSGGVNISSLTGTNIDDLIQQEQKEEIVLYNKIYYGDSSTYSRKSNLFNLKFKVRNYNNPGNSNLPDDIIFTVKVNTGTSHTGGYKIIVHRTGISLYSFNGTSINYFNREEFKNEKEFEIDKEYNLSFFLSSNPSSTSYFPNSKQVYCIVCGDLYLTGGTPSTLTSDHNQDFAIVFNRNNIDLIDFMCKLDNTTYKTNYNCVKLQPNISNGYSLRNELFLHKGYSYKINDKFDSNIIFNNLIYTEPNTIESEYRTANLDISYIENPKINIVLRENKNREFNTIGNLTYTLDTNSIPIMIKYKDLNNFIKESNLGEYVIGSFMEYENIYIEPDEETYLELEDYYLFKDNLYTLEVYKKFNKVNITHKDLNETILEIENDVYLNLKDTKIFPKEIDNYIPYLKHIDLEDTIKDYTFIYLKNNRSVNIKCIDIDTQELLEEKHLDINLDTKWINAPRIANYKAEIYDIEVEYLKNEYIFYYKNQIKTLTIIGKDTDNNTLYRETINTITNKIIAPILDEYYIIGELEQEVIKDKLEYIFIYNKIAEIKEVTFKCKDNNDVIIQEFKKEINLNSKEITSPYIIGYTPVFNKIPIIKEKNEYTFIYTANTKIINIIYKDIETKEILKQENKVISFLTQFIKLESINNYQFYQNLILEPNKTEYIVYCQKLVQDRLITIKSFDLNSKLIGNSEYIIDINSIFTIEPPKIEGYIPTINLIKIEKDKEVYEVVYKEDVYIDGIEEFVMELIDNIYPLDKVTKYCNFSIYNKHKNLNVKAYNIAADLLVQSINHVSSFGDGNINYSNNYNYTLQKANEYRLKAREIEIEDLDLDLDNIEMFGDGRSE